MEYTVSADTMRFGGKSLFTVTELGARAYAMEGTYIGILRVSDVDGGTAAFSLILDVG